MKRLTERQRECLRLSATLHDTQIALRLGISVHSVRKHIVAAKSRLGVQDRKSALRMLASFEGGENGGLPALQDEWSEADKPAAEPNAARDGSDADEPVAKPSFSLRTPWATGIHPSLLILASSLALVIFMALVAAVLRSFDTVRW